MDNKNFLLLYNSTTSQEKAEKVVYEPKTPIIKKYLIKISDELLISNALISNPIIKDPRTLAKKVPIGRLGKNKLKKLDEINLKLAPKAPPVATQKMLIKIIN